MPQATIGPGQNVATLVVEFEFEPEQAEEVVEAIKRAVSNTVSKQPGFVSENLHLSSDRSKILNYFQWTDIDAVNSFMNDKETMEKVMAEIGSYGPKPKTYDVVFGVS